MMLFHMLQLACALPFNGGIKSLKLFNFKALYFADQVLLGDSGDIWETSCCFADLGAR
jgi:hypothetical protein